MSIYAISDLHLSFGEGIDKPMDIYGGEWTDHPCKLKKIWTQTIAPEDTVILAGDISWALKLHDAMPDLDWIDSLPGRKLIVKGNHDLWWTGITRMNRLYENIAFLQNTFYPAEGWAICGSRGWLCPGSEGFTLQDEKIYRRELLRLRASLASARDSGFSKILGVMHYPPANDKFQPSGFMDLFSEFGADTVVYGHLHGEDACGHAFERNMNGVEYRMVSLDYLKNRPLRLK